MKFSGQKIFFQKSTFYELLSKNKALLCKNLGFQKKPDFSILAAGQWAKIFAANRGPNPARSGHSAS